MKGIIEKIFGTYSEKELKRIYPIVDKIEALEPEMQKLSDDELKAKTAEFKRRMANGETQDDIMPEAYAAVREAGIRAIGQRAFRAQLIGGVILFQGRVAEMKTGEGKTLTCVFPSYLHALAEKGVHVVTVNEYLAKYQGEWMAKIHAMLDLTVGTIFHALTPDERRQAYGCDITYATNNELGFDYLRDNMVVYKEDQVLRSLHYAIIDEADSILIDEARTPLIISGSGNKSTQLYKVADSFAKGLKKGRIINEDEAMNPLMRVELKEEGDFYVDEKQKTATLTQDGIRKAERFFAVENISDPDNLEIMHHINNALKACYTMHRDQNYVVDEKREIVIVDEFTGRLMPGRRYSDGLHQAIEAKENVTVNRESRTLATITFQNFFNKYYKKAGMTGTALTEENEFREIYGMDVVVVPTNKPMIRKDLSDMVYKTEAAKFRAVVEDTYECHQRRQPVLIGTITIEKSEELSKLLKKRGIPHQVLNAKYHEKEAEIVALAGQPGAVTIATNMAGRGTDIMLGPGVTELGGLKIVGTERHESRRIDNQLRGRAGRQGDPGLSRFYIALEDDLMRLFGSERIKGMLETLGLKEDDPIENKMLSGAIENAQKKVESNNFGIRKHLLDYDRVMNEQREIIYGERKRVLLGENLRETIMNMMKSIIEDAVKRCAGDAQYPEDWNIKSLSDSICPMLGIPSLVFTLEEQQKLTVSGLSDQLFEIGKSRYEKREKEFQQNAPEGEEDPFRELERIIMLKVVDQKWMDHLDDMDQMRQGISLRAYAQKDPLTEYRFLSYDMFNELSENIKKDTVRILSNMRTAQQPMKREQVAKPHSTNKDEGVSRGPVRRSEAKIGRNDSCNCGSGKKYKHCCGMGK
ncbi:MAG: preprotein translocase subunit SecA [Defluviitaleaceae bacterium]|nr:preprotein translocase subunit SecA [Defluviitaleaceae bacterium]MCL2836342.1 preprotein translocase subunit SecA [Defluviitaleaceae bacterium]